MKRKTLLFTLLALLLVFTLAACGGNNESTTEASDENTPAATKEPTPTQPQPSATEQVRSSDGLLNPNITLRKIKNDLEGWAEERWNFWM